MKIIDKGYQYDLEGFIERKSLQTLTFVKKVPAKRRGDSLVIVHDGTTVEEVLAVLIHRLQFLNGKLPNRHTANAIVLLTDALGELNTRTFDRVKRNVRGTNEP